MLESQPTQVTQLLEAVTGGRPGAAEELVPLVYQELRRLARWLVAREPAGSSLQATALVHEAYLRLVGNSELAWRDRAHFFRAAAQAMRRILTEHARRRGRIKHGGGRRREPLDEAATIPAADTLDVLALDEAITRLSAVDARKGEVVSLRYFAGLSIEETAQALEVSPATVKNDWIYARAWLHRELSGEDGSSDQVGHAP